jgi:hypothetical protein
LDEAESDQDDADEGMRSDTEENTKQEANGTGDTNAKVGKGRKRKREAWTIMEGASLRRHVAPDGDGRTTPFGGAAPALSGGLLGRGRGGGVAGGGSWQLAESRPRQITQSHRWIAASCQCGHTGLPSRRRLA